MSVQINGLIGLLILAADIWAIVSGDGSSASAPIPPSSASNEGLARHATRGASPAANCCY